MKWFFYAYYPAHIAGWAWSICWCSVEEKKRNASRPLDVMVEHRGIEPLTYGLQSRRSPQLS